MSEVAKVQNGKAAKWAVGLFILLTLMAWGYGRIYSVPPPAIFQTDCALPLETIQPAASWRFQSDPDNLGLDEGWFVADFDDAQWEQSAPGIPWEQHGHDGYDGIGWYRAAYQIPADWEQAYLGTVQVDDAAQMWINGQETPFNTLIKLPEGLPADLLVQISYRIDDFGGYGGIKAPVWVGRTPQAALSGGDYGRYLAASHPNWPLPGWTRGAYHAWTFTGAPAAANEALITSKAAVAPWAEAPIVEWWFLTNDGELLT
ncbi:MAG: hypothetical protein GY803_06770, partial [Chloroflexi bacterium]|nr:hypothetical protein [Chloroflexota bacterium]